MFLLLRKGQFGEKLETEVEIFLIFLLMFLRFKKQFPISENRSLQGFINKNL